MSPQNPKSPLKCRVEVSSLPEFKPVKTSVEEDVDASEWSTRDVATWLYNLGLGDYASAFAEHKVTGNILPVLSESHFKELGVILVGERALLCQETAKLYRGAVNKRRFRTIWQATGRIYSKGCFDWFCKHLMCVPCCQDPDHYRLTGTTLYVSEIDHKRYNSAFCSTSKHTRAIDLSTIAGVHDLHRSTVCDCGCSADEVTVELDGEKNLAVVRPLLVEKGSGADIAKKINAAMEDAQLNNSAPAGQTMLRI